MENQELYKMDQPGIYTIVHKNGVDDQEPRQVKIVGNIDSVSRYLKQRYLKLKESGTLCNIQVDRDSMDIELIVEEDSPFFDEITGKLSHAKEFTQWEINTGKGWEHKQLSEFIKMNRSCFTDKGTAMQLSSELSSVKIKAEKEFENSDNNKGDYRVLAAQKVIESNVPSNFKLNVHIFKGQTKSEFEVEVYVNPNNYNVTLVSPEVNDFINEYRDQIIDKEIEEIKELAPELVIIEV